MSREIKFRAWDKVEKIMRREVEIHCYDDGSVGWWGEHSGRPAESFELMQYTGLKDKNGVEIYEGDILAGNWIVVWHEAGFYLHIKEIFSDTLYIPISRNQESEVIGNIYENPELLK